MFANILTCTNKIQDDNGNVIKYELIDEFGTEYEAPPKELKRKISKGEIHVTNIRLSKKGNLVGIHGILHHKKSYFLSELEMRKDEVLWGYVRNNHGERNGWLPVAKINTMVNKHGAAVYGFSTRKIEAHNYFTAELANIKEGTPVVFRMGVYQSETQALFLGTRYDDDFEETKFIFFDGVSGQNGRFEIGLGMLYNGRSELSIEYGILSKKAISKVMKDAELFNVNKAHIDNAIKAVMVYKEWKPFRGSKWAFGK